MALKEGYSPCKVKISASSQRDQVDYGGSIWKAQCRTTGALVSLLKTTIWVTLWQLLDARQNMIKVRRTACLQGLLVDR